MRSICVRSSPSATMPIAGSYGFRSCGGNSGDGPEPNGDKNPARMPARASLSPRGSMKRFVWLAGAIVGLLLAAWFALGGEDRSPRRGTERGEEQGTAAASGQV